MRLLKVVRPRFAIAAVSVGLMAVVLLSYWRERRHAEEAVTLLDPAKVLVIRTPGGLLEVATLVRSEEFAWTSKRVCPVIDCSKLLGVTTTRIRVPVHYNYRIPLSGSWQLHPEGNSYILEVPAEEPSLPAAADFSRMEIETKRGWLSPGTTENRERLLRELQPELDRRAAQPSYVDAQRAEARTTITEFAQKWMQEQKLPLAAIRVRFADEGQGGS